MCEISLFSGARFLPWAASRCAVWDGVWLLMFVRTGSENVYTCRINNICSYREGALFVFLDELQL